jgi:DNA transformation protein and related proteins
MAVQPQYLAYVLEQLGGLERVSTRRMFGGVGLYSSALFFGLIDDDTLFFKTDASNAAEYQARRMPRFMPPANRPMGPMGYHQVPADIIEDGESLVSWARRSVAVALASQAKKARPGKRAAKKKAATRPARATLKSRRATAASAPGRRATPPARSRSSRGTRRRG